MIDYNGDILPCTHFVGFPLLNIFENGPEISKEEFISQYNNPKSTPYKFRESMNKYPSDKCNDTNCDEPCGGGCPLFWIRFDPSKEIKGMNSKN